MSRVPGGAKLPCLLLAFAALSACGEAPAPPAPEPRPVRVVTVESRGDTTTVSLTGTIQAQTEVNLGFRIDGRMIERLVNVGDRVTAGQVIARLDRTNEENGLRAARAALVAGQAQLVEAEANYSRASELLRSGFGTRQRYDQAAQQRQTARSAVDSAQAQVNIAENRLSYSELLADAPGTVTARGAEAGEVVAPGRMVVRLARQDGLDAVFDVPPAVMDRAPPGIIVAVALTLDPVTRANGRVREVSPSADPVTGTFRVRIGLEDPPPGLRLGSTVTGRMELQGGTGYALPASALTRQGSTPAVWVVDTNSQTVSLRPVEILRHDPARAVIGSGVAAGDVVVTAGVQVLRPGQRVRLLDGAR
ncbi:efflux RND transporter periplasmic adaptor subunit [Falsiroseomonas sp.]|uniref:efflux RND transporter periplasmic adaptor subunit n=1 Tax=Falsiroseomonas sp. TaxID=2870721 RepID=UPI002734ECE2|nr:efflux RND transporter periplasmic adaptor subunit [Falsiroseomonas sp.]MDP3418620.1 efflux RND transporter periplasmic adaptor subunit [Falsiroseomonas sp.]